MIHHDMSWSCVVSEHVILVSGLSWLLRGLTGAISCLAWLQWHILSLPPLVSQLNVKQNSTPRIIWWRHSLVTCWIHRILSDSTGTCDKCSLLWAPIVTRTSINHWAGWSPSNSTRERVWENVLSWSSCRVTSLFQSLNGWKLMEFSADFNNSTTCSNIPLSVVRQSVR